MRLTSILSTIRQAIPQASFEPVSTRMPDDHLKLSSASIPQSNLEPPQWILPSKLNRYRTPGVVPSTLKIGLQVEQPSVTFHLDAPIQVGTMTLSPGKTYQVSPQGSQLDLTIPGDATFAPLRCDPPLILKASEPGSFMVGKHRYRGDLEVEPSPGVPGKVTLINQVGLEDYLLGVVPSEMAHGWPGEALKAQAVAARTYAAANIGRRSAKGFDLYATVDDQVYKGMSVESPDTTAAVRQTKGQILTYHGAPIDALFHSSSGGETDDALEVWGIDLPYIQGVKDIDESPNRQWTQRYSQQQVLNALAKLGVDVGAVEHLTITSTTHHGRARELMAQGTKGTSTVDANRFRLAIGLKSTRFSIFPTTTGWKFHGGGYGHGLGMSQWGARSYAERGKDYKTILMFYYTGVQLTTVHD